MDPPSVPVPVLSFDWLDDLASTWPVYRMSPGVDPTIVISRRRPTPRATAGYLASRGASSSAVQVDAVADLVAVVLDWRLARGRLRRGAARSTHRLPLDHGALATLVDLEGGIASLTVAANGFLVTLEAVDDDLARVVSTASDTIGPPDAVDSVLGVLNRFDPRDGGFDVLTSGRAVPGYGVVLDRWVERGDRVVAQVEVLAEDRRVFGRCVELASWDRSERRRIRHDLFAGPGGCDGWWDSPAVAAIPGPDEHPYPDVPSDPVEHWTAHTVPAPTPTDPGCAPTSAPGQVRTLGPHSWAWRVVRREFEGLLAEPERLGELSAIEVLEVATSMLATGPSSLPDLAEVLVASAPGDACAVRDHVRDVMTRWGR